MTSQLLHDDILSRTLDDLRASKTTNMLAMLDSQFAVEVESLIRTGQTADAIDRIERYRQPKFPNVGACMRHVGQTTHFTKDIP